MNRSQTLLLLLLAILALAAACDFIDDDGTFEPVVPGIIYNSNDGACATTGVNLDFYFDSEFAASVGSGDSVEDLKTPGSHTIEVFVAGTDQRFTTFELHINSAGWWVWAGCPDGTHP